MITTTVKSISELNDEGVPLEVCNVYGCPLCGSHLQYVQNSMGLVQYDKDIKPLIMPVDLIVYCATCGEKHIIQSMADKEDIILIFEDAIEAKNVEYLLSMKNEAISINKWTEDKYQEIKDKIEEFKKERGWTEDGTKRKRKNPKTSIATKHHRM